MLILFVACCSWLAQAGGDPSPALEVARRAGAHLQRPAWSPDATRVSYEANFHDAKVIELYVGDPHQRTFRRVQPVVRDKSTIAAGFGSSSASTRVAHELSWSRKEPSRYVYTASNDAKTYDLFLSTGTPIAPSPSNDGSAAWSPDGRWLVFTSARTGQGDLYLVPTGDLAAPPKRLTRDEESAELFPIWSPDSQSIVYVGKGKQGDHLFLLPKLDEPPVALTSWSGTQTAPSFSPDGTQIAFYANRNERDRFDLYVVRAQPGATPSRLATDVVPNTGPRWTPDGLRIVYVCNDDERYDPLCVIESYAGAFPRTLDFGTVGHGDLDLARDASGVVWIAYVAQGRVDDVDRSFKRLFIQKLP